MKKVLQTSMPAILLIVLLGLFSCNKDEVETVPLGSVNINMYELSPYYSREFGLQVITDLDTYPIYYEIRYNTKIEGSTITINLNDIEKINYSGSTATGNVSTYVPIGALTKSEYDIQIKVVDKINTGKLKINPAFYTLSFDNTNDLTVNDDTLRRVPDNALWGYVGYADSTTTALAQTFIDTLISIGSTQLAVAPGNYFYFQYGTDSVFTQPIDASYNYAKEFYLKYTQSITAINEVVNTYYNDPAYKKLHISINWFYAGAAKSALIRPEDPETMMKIPFLLK